MRIFHLENIWFINFTDNINWNLLVLAIEIFTEKLIKWFRFIAKITAKTKFFQIIFIVSCFAHRESTGKLMISANWVEFVWNSEKFKFCLNWRNVSCFRNAWRSSSRDAWKLRKSKWIIISRGSTLVRVLSMAFINSMIYRHCNVSYLIICCFL